MKIPHIVGFKAYKLMKRLTTRLSKVVLAQTAKKCLGGSRMYGATARKAFGAEGGKSSFSSVEIDELNNVS